MKKCEVCKANEAVWAIQDIAGVVAAYRVGYHIRGFEMTLLCDKCKTELKCQGLYLEHDWDIQTIGTTGFTENGPAGIGDEVVVCKRCGEVYTEDFDDDIPF